MLAQDVLRRVLGGEDGNAALLPADVATKLQDAAPWPASIVVPDLTATVERVTCWMAANPYELRKCTSTFAAANVVLTFCTHQVTDELAEAMEQVIATLHAGRTAAETAALSGWVRKRWVMTNDADARASTRAQSRWILLRDDAKAMKLATAAVQQSLPPTFSFRAALLANGDVAMQVKMPLKSAAGEESEDLIIKGVVARARQVFTPVFAGVSLPKGLAGFVVGRGGREVRALECGLRHHLLQHMVAAVLPEVFVGVRVQEGVLRATVLVVPARNGVNVDSAQLNAVMLRQLQAHVGSAQRRQQGAIDRRRAAMEMSRSRGLATLDDPRDIKERRGLRRERDLRKARRSRPRKLDVLRVASQLRREPQSKQALRTMPWHARCACEGPRSRPARDTRKRYVEDDIAETPLFLAEHGLL